MAFIPKSISAKETVNILTWWGYLNDSKQLKRLEKKCNIKISYDEFHSNAEFIRRWEKDKNNYDIAIYSNTIYVLIKKDLPKTNINLIKLINNYDKPIRKKFLGQNYPNNTGLFAVSLSGFLWNKKIINIKKNDKINEIFKKAKNNYTVLIDDHVEILRLLSADKKNNIDLRSKFSNIREKAKIIITNEIEYLVKNKNFAFAYTWSGDALRNFRSLKKDFGFMIHPKLSHVSTDLLSINKSKKEAQCVGKGLLEKKFLQDLHNKTFYFSPYGVPKNTKNKIQKNIYKDFVKNPGVEWIKLLNGKEFFEMEKTWKMIKIDLNKSNQ